MEIEKRFQRFTFLFVIFCYALITALLWIIRWQWKGNGGWVDQVYLLIAFSFLLSLALFAFRRRRYSRFIFIFKAIIQFLQTNILFVLGADAGYQWGLETSFLAILIIEIGSYFALWPSVILSSSIIVLGIFNVMITLRFDSSFPRISSSDLLSLAAIGLVAGIATNVLRGLVSGLELQRKMNERMNKAVSLLIDANIGFQNVATAAGQESARQERTRLSRDIHDTAVHSLINIIMLAESIDDKVLPDQSEISGMLGMIISQAKDAVKETRLSLRELRNMEEESPRGLRAIHELIAVYTQATGVEVGINYGNLPWHFGEDIDEALYRMIQEGLTNAFRHGKATKIQINLWIVRGKRLPEICFSMYDNGLGSEQIKKGIGLQGMEERIQKLHGSFAAESRAGGFHINASIPFDDAEDGV